MTAHRPARSTATRVRAVVCVLLSFSLAACLRAESSGSEPLVVFAASNLRDALTEIAREHQAVGGDSIVLVFGSTGDLAKQITNGAPADLFFAADAEAIETLAASGAVVESTRQLYAVGRLAIIARCTRADTAGERGACPRLTLRDLVADSLRSVAIADPSHAPYGRAAKQAFERSGLWETVRPKLVFGASIAQAEQFVTTGNADAGVVALSLLRKGTERAYTIVDSSLHDPLLHSVAVVSRSTRRVAALALVEYIRSAAGRALMDRYGFAPPPSGVPAPRDS